MTFLLLLYDLIRNLGDDAKWQAILDHVGQPTLYAILIAIVFCETGLVIFPFLPGDSLLFAIGAIGARENIGLNLPLISALLIIAAVAGDALNYAIGYRLGPKVFSRADEGVVTDESGTAVANAAPIKKRSLADKLLNKKHLLRAQEFYEKYGAKTIILARFVPIVRTFAPFVAGVGRMSYPKFFAYNVVGAIAWVLICVYAGKFFGEFKFVKDNFELVIIAIVIISVVPMVIEVCLEWRKVQKAKAAGILPPDA